VTSSSHPSSSSRRRHRPHQKKSKEEEREKEKSEEEEDGEEGEKERDISARGQKHPKKNTAHVRDGSLGKKKTQLHVPKKKKGTGTPSTLAPPSKTIARASPSSSSSPRRYQKLQEEEQEGKADEGGSKKRSQGRGEGGGGGGGGKLRMESSFQKRPHVLLSDLHEPSSSVGSLPSDGSFGGLRAISEATFYGTRMRDKGKEVEAGFRRGREGEGEGEEEGEGEGGRRTGGGESEDEYFTGDEDSTGISDSRDGYISSGEVEDMKGPRRVKGW
jgi:hypothetical protein